MNKRLYLAIATSLALAATLVLLLAQPAEMQEEGNIGSEIDSANPAATIAISGTVTDPGASPVPNVSIQINSTSDERVVTTDVNGYYSTTMESTSYLIFWVRPPLSTGLAQYNYRRDNAVADLSQDFSLTEGYTLSLHVLDSTGVTVTQNAVPELWPLGDLLTSTYFYVLDWQPATSRHFGVLPPDVYYVTYSDPPEGYYQTTQVFDLRSSDQISSMQLNTIPVNPIPFEPPDATQMSVGPIDDLGEAVVSGGPGAAMPLTRILLVNLSTFHQASTTSEADGSFSARIFAPPGSSIMVKQGPPGQRWSELEQGLATNTNPFPGTIVYVPHTHTGSGGEAPFAATGPIHPNIDDLGTTRNYVGAAWVFTGTIGPSDHLGPGDIFQVSGTFRLYGPAITATTNVTDIIVAGAPRMNMAFDQAGHPRALENYFLSTMLTPSGLPIQGNNHPSLHPVSGSEIQGLNLQYIGGHTLQSNLVITAELPSDMPEGIYSLNFELDFAGVPTSTEWLAANSSPTYGYRTMMRPIWVGDVGQPHLIWSLLTDNYAQGLRGTSARQDQGLFELASQIATQDSPYVVPPFDPLTGMSITYRLEPFLPMLSYSDRRMPNAPLIPLTLPGGEISVQVQEPDGSVIELGGHRFAQSFNRSPTTVAGYDVNPGTTQLNDVYSLMVDSSSLRVTFDQYGHHIITMTGVLSDVWGNVYFGGGTYDVWVAHLLDIDPGVLPGTPLTVTDSYNPAVQIYPHVPAEISMAATIYPNSNPDLAVHLERNGQANSFGYLGSAEPIPIELPGEIRLDVTARYSDTNGWLYMGTRAWGGVVMSPTTELIAHGRRGLDSLTTTLGVPSWFVNCRDLSFPAGNVKHTLNPYYNGDMIWSRMVDGPGECPEEPSGGDSLVLNASLRDLTGAVESAIETRYNRMQPGLGAPGTFSERQATGELPLFMSTYSGRAATLVLGQLGDTLPDDIDQVAYSYRSSQRPGVRVREVVAEDIQTGGYWRLDTLYDDQFGVGVLGDQPNDFKFQYLGLVYRDLDTGRSEYLGQGSGWIFIPDSDTVGSRTMPPFAGYGGWTGEGGPILTLLGEDIHMFILPTGVRPGAVLEMGDTFRFGGHIMPTLNSRVAYTVTAPSGTPHFGGGQANSIGYFYDPTDDFPVEEPGIWSVDVHIWHDGRIGNGQQVLCATDPLEPCPSGDVLGSADGRYWFYAVPPGNPRLNVSSPQPGFLSFNDTVTPIVISGTIPLGMSDPVVSYTISMPGYILQYGNATVSGGVYQITFDPAALSADFPNLDLISREDLSRAGLADSFAIGLMLRGDGGEQMVYQANAITIQGERVFVDSPPPTPWRSIYLPLVLRGG